MYAISGGRLTFYDAGCFKAEDSFSDGGLLRGQRMLAGAVGGVNSRLNMGDNNGIIRP